MAGSIFESSSLTKMKPQQTSCGAFKKYVENISQDVTQLHDTFKHHECATVVKVTKLNY